MNAKPFSTLLICAGILNFALFGGALAGWSWMAPLKSAVIAPGFVNVDSYRKKVQHLEGGIVDEILVRDGDVVTKGQLLVRMRNLAQTAAVSRLQSQLFESLAIAAQSVAERDGLDVITFPPELTGSDSPAAKSAMTAQQNVFESQRRLFQQTMAVMTQKVRQSEADLRGLEGQLAAIDTQLMHFEVEIADAQTLYKKELMVKSRLLKLQREIEERRGERSKVEGQLANRRQEILELELKMAELQSCRIAGAVERLREHQTKIYEFGQLLIASQDILRRTEIRSPIDGTIVDIQVHTRDGVVAAGQTLMDVVPASDQLVVEGRLRPEDREEVRTGQDVYVQLTTMGRRDPRPIRGRLESISADRLVDKDLTQPYYRVRIHLEPSSVQQQGVEVLAGMGAEVFIQTGERTPLQYMVAPFVRAFNRGLREQ